MMDWPKNLKESCHWASSKMPHSCYVNQGSNTHQAVCVFAPQANPMQIASGPCKWKPQVITPQTLPSTLITITIKMIVMSDDSHWDGCVGWRWKSAFAKQELDSAHSNYGSGRCCATPMWLHKLRRFPLVSRIKWCLDRILSWGSSL